MALDAAIIARARSELYTAVISDILDSVGFPNQALPPNIRPLDDSLTLFGRARTGLYMDVYGVTPGENPYDVEIRLIDDLKADEIPVLACGKTGRVAPWGELLTTATRCRGGIGMVCDGLVRDVKRIREMQFPVFCAGIGPLDTMGRGKMMSMDVPVEVGGVAVKTGDWVFGDVDGLCFIPEQVLEEVITKSFEKVKGENMTRDELLKGSLLMDVYNKYGIL